MSIMGGSAAGAALWGEVLSHTSLAASPLASAALALVLLPLTRRFTLESGAPAAVAPQ